LTIAAFFLTLQSMTEIGRHIVLLLLTNDCVIVPDFGGFIVHHIDAAYDEGQGLYYPPRQSLGFNPQLKLNDSLLAYSYAEAYDMSFPEASERLAGDVERLVAEINDKGRYEIDDIGTIRLNSEGAYEFEPFESGVLTPSLYGLSSFGIEPVAAAKPAGIQAEKAATDIEKTASQSHIELYANNLDDKDEAERPSDSEFILIPKRWVRYAAVACVALMLLLIVPLPTSTIMQTLRAGQMDSSLLYRMFPKMSTSAPVAELKSEPAKPHTPQNQKPKVQNPKPAHTAAAPKTEPTVANQPAGTAAKAAEMAADKASQQAGRFTIVLASKVSRANAERFVSQIAAKGYAEGRVAKMSQGYRVVYGSYKNWQEANASKHKLDSNELFDGCWIMKCASGKELRGS